MTDRVHVVFLGPSLGLDEARSLHPEAIFLPPAAQGDVLDALRRYRPQAIGIIDGVFTQRLSVFHKEILYAMSWGTWMLGSSSMGALRAAECDAFGMIGVGSVYQSIVDGELTDDDEVALTHTHLDDGLRVLSLPMVTIRATLQALADDGLLTLDERDEIAARQKARFFPERSVGSIGADARAAGIEPDRVQAIRARFADDPVDPKAADARTLLSRLRQLPDGLMPPDERPDDHHSHTFHALLERDALFHHDGDVVGREELVRHVAVAHPDFDELRGRALEREALLGLADLAGIRPTPADVEDEERRWRRTHDLAADAAWEGHRRDAQLTDDEWSSFFERQALASRLRRWAVSRMHLRRTVRPVLDELVRRGELLEWIEEATLSDHLWRVAGHHAPSADENQKIADLRSLGWTSGGDVAAWMRESGFEHADELLEAARRAAFSLRLRSELEEAVDEGVAPGAEDLDDAEAAAAHR